MLGMVNVIKKNLYILELELHPGIFPTLMHTKKYNLYIWEYTLYIWEYTLYIWEYTLYIWKYT